MGLPQRAAFNAHTLNLGYPKTEMMRRKQAASGEVVLQLLDEHLQKKGVKAISLNDLQEIFVTELQIGVNRARHLMPELGWSSVTAEWGGIDHARTAWVSPGYQLSNGSIVGPDGFNEKFDGDAEFGGMHLPDFEMPVDVEVGY